jgi:hypothetical protein
MAEVNYAEFVELAVELAPLALSDVACLDLEGPLSGVTLA